MGDDQVRDTKQIIVVRKDLGMNVGKACAQVAHASMMFISRAMRGGVLLQEMPEPMRVGELFRRTLVFLWPIMRNGNFSRR